MEQEDGDQSDTLSQVSSNASTEPLSPATAQREKERQQQSQAQQSYLTSGSAGQAELGSEGASRDSGGRPAANSSSKAHGGSLTSDLSDVDDEDDDLEDEEEAEDVPQNNNSGNKTADYGQSPWAFQQQQRSTQQQTLPQPSFDALLSGRSFSEESSQAKRKSPSESADEPSKRPKIQIDPRMQEDGPDTAHVDALATAAAALSEQQQQRPPYDPTVTTAPETASTSQEPSPSPLAATRFGVDQPAQAAEDESSAGDGVLPDHDPIPPSVPLTTAPTTTTTTTTTNTENGDAALPELDEEEPDQDDEDDEQQQQQQREQQQLDIELPVTPEPKDQDPEAQTTQLDYAEQQEQEEEEEDRDASAQPEPDGLFNLTLYVLLNVRAHTTVSADQNRNSAIESLFKIEIEFAKLRDALFLERMAEASHEKKLVSEDQHPDLVHLNEWITSRRTTRLDVASKWRDRLHQEFDVEREAAERMAWSQWSEDRARLKSDMLDQVNGKRRAIEREKRVSDRGNRDGELNQSRYPTRLYYANSRRYAPERLTMILGEHRERRLYQYHVANSSAAHGLVFSESDLAAAFRRQTVPREADAGMLGLAKETVHDDLADMSIQFTAPRPAVPPHWAAQMPPPPPHMPQQQQDLNGHGAHFMPQQQHEQPFQPFGPQAAAQVQAHAQAQSQDQAQFKPPASVSEPQQPPVAGPSKAPDHGPHDVGAPSAEAEAPSHTEGADTTMQHQPPPQSSEDVPTQQQQSSVPPPEPTTSTSDHIYPFPASAPSIATSQASDKSVGLSVPPSSEPAKIPTPAVQPISAPSYQPPGLSATHQPQQKQQHAEGASQPMVES